MRVSLEWLKEYVDISGLSPEEIAEALTNAGLEVEAIEHLGAKFEGVVVGKIQAINPHPDADKLRLVTVNWGQGPEGSPSDEDTPAMLTQVVCGAPNVREGILVAFALDGAMVISRKDGTLFKLGKAKIRGVESTGMICSLEELGLEAQFQTQEDGIWPLDGIVSESAIGQDLKIALGLQGDVVIEVAPTANRGDLMSVLGVAREVAALFDRTLHHPQWPYIKEVRQKHEFRVGLHDAEVCRYYSGVTMNNVRIGPSPEWMSRRLVAAGVRSINNVVDITNYVMLEMGQPLHAFDRNKLELVGGGKAGKIDVRRANADEKMRTLDGLERTLNPDAVLVTLNDNPVALAGVMGGADTEIDDQSREILLESACFHPAAIRKSAKSVGLRSESSARFERGVDVENCRNALLRAASLLQKHADASVESIAESPLPVQSHTRIALHFQRIEKIIGLAIEADTVNKILKKLGFLLQPTKESSCVMVDVPSFRHDDISRDIDLIEEVIRIHGYDKIPYTLPQKTGTSATTLRSRMIKTIGQAIRGQGLQEIVTTSLIGQNLLEKTGFTLNPDQQVSVLNSHSSDHTLMRQSLLPNMIEIAKLNQSQGNEDIWVYELGRTYYKLGKASLKNSGVSERLCLGGLITGSPLSGQWHQKETVDFYRIKGILENLFVELGLEAHISFVPGDNSLSDQAPYLHPGKAAVICVGPSAKQLGVLGELHPEVQKTLKFRQAVYVFELNVELLYKTLKQTSQQGSGVQLSPYPAIKRDMAFLVPKSVTHQAVEQALQFEDEPLLRNITLFDEYTSEQLGADKRSLAYRLTFQSEASTMTDSEVDARFAKLKKALSERLPIQFR